MRPASTNEKTIVDMDLYRQRRTAALPKPQPIEPAEEALNEIARYLLMAVKVITSRRH